MEKCTKAGYNEFIVKEKCLNGQNYFLNGRIQNMRMTNKVTAMALASMMALSLAGCGGSSSTTATTAAATEAAKETTAAATEAAKEAATTAAAAAATTDVADKKVGISIYKFDDNFMTLYRTELVRYLTEDLGFKAENVVVQDGKGDQAEQTNQIQNFITQKYDVLILNLVQASSAPEITDMCKEAGIPVVYINREPDAAEEERWESEGLNATYVGCDARQSGTYQGEEILETANKGDINGDGKVSYIMIQGDPENVDAQYRTEFSVKALTDAGMEVELKQAITEDEVIAQCQDAEIFIVQYAKITEKVMDNCPKLKYVVRYGVGVDTIDVPAATKHGIQIGNVPDYGMNEVADHAISLALAMVRKIVKMNAFTKAEKWDYTNSIPVHRFNQMTVGVIGLGRIGRNFAKKMNALGFKVIGTDPYFKPTPETDEYVTPVTMEEVIEKSDVISLHCPADGNIDLFNKETFKKMKNNAVLINVARGGIINEEDLDQALTDGEIAGAALDCMLGEPVSKDSPLFKHENVIVTPHMAWYSEEAAQELKRKVAEESVRFANGEEIHYPINHLS